MMPFMLRPWWTVASVLLMVAWLAFLAVGARTKQSYLVELAPELPRGTQADWRNKEGKLILRGWSNPEATFRWSDSAAPEVCLKPQVPVPPGPKRENYVVGLQMAAIDTLIGKDIAVTIDGRIAPGTIHMQPDWAWYWIDVGSLATSRVTCIALDLAATSRQSLREPRRLGVRLMGVELK
jgi:hypothetical protein